MRDSEKTQVLSILLHGPHGCGKTALAAYIARGAQFPFMKLVTPDNFIGYSVRFCLLFSSTGKREPASVSHVLLRRQESPICYIQ